MTTEGSIFIHFQEFSGHAKAHYPQNPTNARNGEQGAVVGLRFARVALLL